MSCRAARAPDA